MKFKKTYLLAVVLCLALQDVSGEQWYPGNDSRLQYTGRVQELPAATRLWTPGAYVRFVFSADTLRIVLHDQLQFGVQHNYVEVQIDDQPPVRIRLRVICDTLLFPMGDNNIHTAVVCKNTESNIGYVDVAGIIANELFHGKNKKRGLFEFFGDSITCGASSDTSTVKCGAGRWEDQHNAYLAYGPVTARTFNADWVLSSVSGIGLMHSCCGMKITMPQVYDKVVMNKDSLSWDFKKYSPDVVCICLGQNDGIQDSLTFLKNYLSFLKDIRETYKEAKIVLLTSPVGDAPLTAFLKKQLDALKQIMNASGDTAIFTYSFRNVYNGGCDYHPSVNEHSAIAHELVAFFRDSGIWNG